MTMMPARAIIRDTVAERKNVRGIDAKGEEKEHYSSEDEHDRGQHPLR